MLNNLKILYLYSELGPYVIPVLKVLTNRYSAEVHVVSWDKNLLKPSTSYSLAGVTFYNKSAMSKSKIVALCHSLSPDLVYVSGWMDKDYFPALKFARSKDIPVVTGFDDKWEGSLRQLIGRVYFFIFYRLLFSHAWVAGPYQYEYARKFGFTNDSIIFDLLTCDSKLFLSSEQQIMKRDKTAGKKFLYVGNFRKVKGFDVLVNAFERYRNELGGSWELICVGNGELEWIAKDIEGLMIVPFQKQDVLVSMANEVGGFILPSIKDQWGVVVHEFCSLGLPILTSDGVGASATFFIEGYNGLSFKRGCAETLAQTMKTFDSLSEETKTEMAINSLCLSKRISAETSAANLVSVTKRAHKF